MRFLILLLFVSCASGSRKPKVTDCDLRHNKSSVAACKQWYKYKEYTRLINRRRGDR
jgi:hypothetical protein